MGGPLKVLIVSSDARVRDPATEVLLRSGFVVDEAFDRRGALRVATSPRPPDVVLLDTATIRDCITDVLSEIEQAAQGRPTRTVLLAGDLVPETVRRHPSVDYVIEAPTAVRELMALADWLERREGRRLRPLSRKASAGHPQSRAS